jgi:hypothetical protein
MFGQVLCRSSLCSGVLLDLTYKIHDGLPTSSRSLCMRTQYEAAAECLLGIIATADTPPPYPRKDECHSPHLPYLTTSSHNLSSHTMTTRIYQGHCHCGQYRYKINVPKIVAARSCPCEICCKIGYLTVTVPKEVFEVTKSSEPLTTYSSGSGTHQVSKMHWST